jgi:hypothetical protein
MLKVRSCKILIEHPVVNEAMLANKLHCVMYRIELPSVAHSWVKRHNRRLHGFVLLTGEINRKNGLRKLKSGRNFRVGWSELVARRTKG